MIPKKDQTLLKHLKLIDQNRRGLGVGLLVFIDETLSREYNKRVILNITYEEVRILGRESISFRFLPYGVEILIADQKFKLTSSTSIPENRWICTGPCDQNCSKSEA